MSITTFICPELRTYHGGVAEVIFRINEADQPTGVICDNFEKGYCSAKLARRQSSYDYKILEANLSGDKYKELLNQTVDRLAEERNIKPRNLNDSQKRDLTVLAERELQQKKDKIRAETDFDTRCAIVRGFQELTVKPGAQ